MRSWTASILYKLIIAITGLCNSLRDQTRASDPHDTVHWHEDACDLRHYWCVQLGWPCEQVDSLPMQVILGQNQVTKTLKLCLFICIATSLKKHFMCFVSVVINIQKGGECQYISMGQPNCTYQCSHKSLYIGAAQVVPLELDILT